MSRLLAQTSRIKSYTELAEWGPLRRKDMSLAELIGLFQDKPMDFAPGERWKYNNSGYVLPGAIIEKVSESETKFFLRVVDGQVEFVKDATGKVTGMVMTQGGRAIPGKKIK